MQSTRVIAVDLDGTVTLTDTLHESVLALVRDNPFFLFLLPFWLMKGIAYLKSKVAENCVLDVSTLPFNLPLLNWLSEEKATGAKIVLCTAANVKVAQAVAKYLDLFDDVISSDDKTNLKGINKRNALEERFGKNGYDYAGNSSADIHAWAGASQAIVVNANATVHRKASKVASVSHTFPSDSASFSDWIRELRVHQWLKNLLLFVPLLAAHQLGNVQALSALLIAFVSFSLCASAVYITNDLFDLESDRRHPRKRNRPFASAKLPIIQGVAVAPLLIFVSIGLGLLVGTEFLIVLLVYLLLTVSYSLFLKCIVLVDCLVFSVFIFLSLALVKRYAELLVQLQVGESVAHGRGYQVSDTSLLQTFGVSSGYISALVIALYMRSEDVLSLYAQPTAIWFVLPILLFWVSWVWLKAARGEMHDDPIVFAIKDKASLLVAGLTAVVFVYAAYGVGI
jgi:4-hydroxybenzoate polyprenyltransferase